jgi:glycosyltransferase involved in cell wall biosynthesis
VAAVSRVSAGHVELRFSYFGQIFWHKGVHLLLEAIKELPGLPLTCHIYGELSAFPDYADRLRRLAARDRRVRFEGFYENREKLSQAIADTDAVVLPSLWYENSPNVILDAFSHRVPVIASNLGGQSELVQHGINGLLFTRNDPANLAEQIHRLVTDPDLLSRLREGIGPVRSIGEEVLELEGIYEEAVKR